MNRRSFLRALGLGAAGAAVAAMELDPERALWVPGRKTFFLPPERSVVVATAADLEALRAAFPGAFMIGTGADGRPQFGRLDEGKVASVLSDEEYRLVVRAGHRILEHKRRIVLA